MHRFHTQTFKLLELLLLFVGVPLIYTLNILPPFHKFSLLGIGVIYSCLYVCTHKSFDWKVLGLNGFTAWRGILMRFSVMIIITSIYMAWREPENLFSIVRERPQLMLLILVFYPLVSVIPQEFIYRSFFFYRYESLFKRKWPMLLLNAALFSWAHIMFHNPIAIFGTFVVGGMYAWLYSKHHSMTAIAIEHALYGVWIFFIGMGGYFYTGG